MKARFFFTGVSLLLVGLLAYHFYAANRAEQTLDETIQEITSKSNLGLTINYSSVEVEPFTGDIRFSDINIIRDEDIQRAAFARFDLTYSDFLNFMIWGTESGLKKVAKGKLRLNKISYVNRDTRLEVKVDSLQLNYRGNLWNLIVLGITGRPAQIRHDIRATGTRFTFSQPDNGIGIVKADSLRFDTHFGRQATDADSLKHFVSLKRITWTPVSSVQEKYRFFIQGFGYETDHIPLDQFDLNSQYNQDENFFLIENMTLVSELFITSIQGALQFDNYSLNRTQLKNISVNLHDMSPRFQNFLTNAEQLFGVRIPVRDEGLSFLLTGTFEEPVFEFMPR